MERTTVLALARRRKTVRRFSPEVPPLESVLYALEVAREAPSGMNAQPWRFVVVDDLALKTRIRAVCEEEEAIFYARVRGEWGSWLQEQGFTPEKPFLSEAPYLICVFSRAEAPYWLQSTWLALGYLLLALEEQGLGTVTYTPPNPRRVAELLGAPPEYKLQTILPVGIPADPKPKWPRKPLKALLGENLFPNDD